MTDPTIRAALDATSAALGRSLRICRDLSCRRFQAARENMR
jgi:hypothetical protein